MDVNKDVKKELMITRYQGRLFGGYYEDSKLTELHVLNDSSTHLLNNIYVGRVQNIVKNLEAAFVEIAPGVTCFYPINESHIFLNPKNTDKLCIGDEILIQVAKEGIKTKAPLATANLQLPGRYLVLLYGQHRVNISAKIPRDDRTEKLKELVSQNLSKSYGVILRTNSYEVDFSEVELELKELQERLDYILKYAKTRSMFSCLYNDNKICTHLFNNLWTSDCQIVTDLPEIYGEVLEYMNSIHFTGDVNNIVHLYEQKMQPLYAIYRFDRDLKEALDKKVWLKSGANLVIEQTEAMVVIDVNTGKSVNKKDKQQHLFNTNVEAAKEIARQLKIRNLSGIIMIDFIDMEDLENVDELIRILTSEIAKDHTKTKFVDLTKLNLIELTRMKIQKTLMEELNECI